VSTICVALGLVVIKFVRSGFYIFSGFCRNGWFYSPRTDPFGTSSFLWLPLWCIGGQVMGLWTWDLELGVAVAGFFYFSSVVGSEL
jgi:hypothetical protein